MSLRFGKLECVQQAGIAILGATVLFHTLFDEQADEEGPIDMRIRLSHRFHRLLALSVTLGMLLSTLFLSNGSTSAQDNELVGDFMVAIARLQVPTDVANGSMVIGRWRVTFNADGTFVLERLDLGVLVTGSYQVDGQTLIVTDESGLMSCSNPAAGTSGQTDVETATYTFKLDSGNLRLSPVDERCALRRVLFATNDFTVFVACLPVAAQNVAEASPVSSSDSALTVLANLATPVIGGRDPIAPSSVVEDEIDSLLSQLTSCWATGDPRRFLLLLSNEFRDTLVDGTEDESSTALRNLRAAMQLPIVWERAGDVEMTGENRAEAVVRTTAADQEEFVRYRFVFEDGAWRWDGTAS